MTSGSKNCKTEVRSNMSLFFMNNNFIDVSSCADHKLCKSDKKVSLQLKTDPWRILFQKNWFMVKCKKFFMHMTISQQSTNKQNKIMEIFIII